jgi:hypothetical protein
MTSEDRITRLEAQLRELKEQQDELQQQLAEAEREQWQGYIDQLEIQLHLAAMDSNDRARELMDRLRSTWAHVRHELDGRSSTATDVGAALRSGLRSAVRDVREALLESRQKIRS